MHQLKTKKDLHLARKAWHMGVGSFALVLTFYLRLNSKEAALLSGLLGFFALVFDLFRLKSSALNNFFISKSSWIIRSSEKETLSGFVFYAFGVSFCFYFYQWKIAILSILFLIFADPIASLGGTLIRSPKVYKTKSLAGAISCFAICFILSMAWLSSELIITIDHLIVYCAVCALIGTVSEIFEIINDNFSLPVLSGALITLFSFLLSI